ncbi:hypothetical protein OS965_33180 [Streptomyces sp. H27-G5]|uniref:hypothetical protein n=1 Tax=Streptomyces sp. H27-G5 TaxID=2996698 RepID=UPI00226E614A|nr:hypothetical protein [Streptomyces sp. H27-G5]MCY0922940.1 hypothetical protein [Streptomyces sp. H27-G5]
MPRSTARDVLAVAAQPVLLLAAVGVFALTEWRGGEPGMATFLFQFPVLGLLVALESLIPYDPSWRPDRREWGYYAVYYVLTAIGGALGQNLVLLAVGAVATSHPPLPLWAEIPPAQTALERVTARLPGLRPAVPQEELRWRSKEFFSGLRFLPVTW